jgi:signal recognition particle receptor subunit beta
MAIVNYKRREINCKIVYVGPSLGGKTTNIQCIHGRLPSDRRSALQCINTEGDRTLFFDYFSLDLERVQGMATKFLIYAVPGQPLYRSTRKMVLSGVDGIVFVADSNKNRLSDNLEAFLELKVMLEEYGYDYHSIPLVFQYNKRDLEDTTPVEEFESLLNDRDCPFFEAIAIENKGVIDTFKTVCTKIIENLNQNLSTYSRPR